jgi:hypothetical protein
MGKRAEITIAERSPQSCCIGQFVFDRTTGLRTVSP